MSRSDAVLPPLSPVLLAGFAARPIPPSALQPILNMAMRQVHSRHPAVFERLQPLGPSSFRIDPVDLPVVFRLEVNGGAPRLTVSRVRDDRPATASIQGPFAALLALLEGRIDGDALFFSRTLVLEGDTEAVLALRNAVDGEDINLLEDFLQYMGPLAGPARALGSHLGRVWSRAGADLATLQRALLDPALRRCDQQEAKLTRLAEKAENAGGRRAQRRVQA